MIKKVITEFRDAIFRGALVIVPGAITIFAFLKIFEFADSFLPGFFKTILPNSDINWIPGTGAILSLFILAGTGLLVRREVGKVLFGGFNALLARTPYLNKLFLAVQQILNSLKKNKNKLFEKAVLIQYPTDKSYCIGFLTGEGGEEISLALDREKFYSVFIPTTPNPTSGFLLYLKDADIYPLNIPVETAIKIVMAAGTVDAKALLDGSEDNRFPDLVKSGEWLSIFKNLPDQFKRNKKS